MKNRLLLLACLMHAALLPSAADDLSGPGPGRGLPPLLRNRVPGGLPPIPGRRQTSITSGANDSLMNKSIITGDDSTFLHPKPQQDLLQSSGAPGFAYKIMPAAGGPRESLSGMTPDGSSFNITPDRSTTFTTKDGMHGMINPDGTGLYPNGSTVTRDTQGAPTLTTPQGYKFQQKSDGSMSFTRTNGLETEFKDGRVRMKQDGQYTNRELKF